MSVICSAAEEEICPWRKPHHQELECPRSAPQSAAARKRKRSSALPPAVPPSVAYGAQYEHSGGARHLGHFDNLVGKRHIAASKNCHQLVHHLRHRIGESRNQRNDVSNLLHGAPQNPHHLRPLLIKSQRPGGKHVPFVVHPEVLRACRPGEGVVWPVALWISLSSSLALAFVGLRRAEWWLYSARSMATLRRSWRRKRLSRRCRLRAAPVALSTFIVKSLKLFAVVTRKNKRALLRANGLSCCCCCCDGWSRQGPTRLPSAHVAGMSGGVAPVDGGHSMCRRQLRVQPSATMASHQGSARKTAKGKATLVNLNVCCCLGRCLMTV